MENNFFVKILKSKILRTLIAVILLSFVLLIFVSLYLRGITNHGQKVLTPSFKGLTVEEAQKLAEEKDIKILIIDSVFESYGEAGTVIDQTPHANFQIKEGRTIFITIKANGQKLVKLPNLTGSLIQVRSLIETAGLKIGKITFVKSDYNNLLLDYTINGENVAAQTLIAVGTKIDLVVGQEEGTEAIVPKFIGLKSTEVAYKAAEYSLNIGQMNYDNSVVSTQDTAMAIVWKQSIKPMSVVEYGLEIDLWLSINPPQN